MGVIGEGVQGVLVANKRGGGKDVDGGGYNRVMGLITIFPCVTIDALFLGEKVW